MIDERNRIEIMLNSIATATPIDDPRDRLELFISAIAEVLSDASTTLTLEPRDRTELLLNAIAEAISTAGLITTESLSVTENGTYTAASGHAYTPVTVAVPIPTLITKSITANGTYAAADDNAGGYSSVTVNVPLPENAYLLKTAAAGDTVSFNDGSAAPLFSLKANITADQAGWSGTSINNYGNTNILGGIAMINNALVCRAGTARPPIDIASHTITINAAQEASKKIFTLNHVKSETAYTFIFTYSKNQDSRASNLRIAYTDGTYDNIPPLDSSVEYGTKGTVVVVTNASKTISYIEGINQGTTATYYCDECGMFEGSLTVDDFETYNGTSVYIPFGTTVNGGTIDISAGIITDSSDNTIQILPTLVKSLVNANNIYVDCGAITECKYFSK